MRSWLLVERWLALLAQHLPAGGIFAVYGPFNYGGTFTSESNRNFDAWLKARDVASGIRDFEAVVQLANLHGLHLLQDHAMPCLRTIAAWYLKSARGTLKHQICLQRLCSKR